MPHISVAEANAYADHSKLTIAVLDADLEASQATLVLADISQTYDVSTWLDVATTPSLVRKIIAMMYVGWFYQRTYSEDEATNSYGLLLMERAQLIMDGITGGTLDLPEVLGPPANPSSPVFYPNDQSSAFEPTLADPSLGGPQFTMGQIW